MCDRACIYRIYRIGAELEFVGFRLRIQIGRAHV